LQVLKNSFVFIQKGILGDTIMVTPTATISQTTNNNVQSNTTVIEASNRQVSSNRVDEIRITGNNSYLSQMRELAYKAGFANNIDEVYSLAQQAANLYINSQNITPVSYLGEVRDFRQVTTLKSNRYHFAQIVSNLLLEITNKLSPFAQFLLQKPVSGGGDTWIDGLKKKGKEKFAEIPSSVTADVKAVLLKLSANATNEDAIKAMIDYAVSQKDLSAVAALDSTPSLNLQNFSQFADRAFEQYTNLATGNLSALDNLAKGIKFGQPPTQQGS
jgi:hypothetical protein